MRGRNWTRADDKRMRAAYARTPTAALAAELGRSVGALHNRANSLALRKASDCIPRGRAAMLTWTAEQDATLRELYADHCTKTIAQRIQRTIRSVYERARKMGLRKSDVYLASAMSARIRKGTMQRGVATQFKPGIRPWNTGLKGYKAGGRSPRFRFAPGDKPFNYLPPGSLRICDGYLQRKVTDTGYPPRDWVGVHRLVWEAVHGPIPAGHAVVFKPGRKATVEADIMLDALELVSRRDLMLRNTRHNLPPEVNELIQLRGALNRKINNRSGTAR